MILWAELDWDCKVILEPVTFPVTETFRYLLNRFTRGTPDSPWWNRKFVYVDRIIAAANRLLDLKLIQIVEGDLDGWRTLGDAEAREVVNIPDNWWRYDASYEARNPDPKAIERRWPNNPNRDRLIRDLHVKGTKRARDMIGDGTFHLLGDTSIPGVYIPYGSSPGNIS
jgi:hypothetical protein